MEDKKIIIKNATVLTMDEFIGDLEKADILINGSEIIRVGKDLDITDAKVIDASNMVALPGFVDCHRHVWQTNLRHRTCDFTLTDYVCYVRALWANLYRPEDVYLGNYAGSLEALEAGVTTVVDHSHIMASPEHSEQAVKGSIDSGIRSVFCYGMWDVPKEGKIVESFTTPQWHYDDFLRIKNTFSNKDQDKVTFGVALNELELSKIALIREEVEKSRQLGAQLLTLHVASPLKKMVKNMHHAGLLGGDMLISHGFYLSDRELELLADCGASVVATPDTELQMGMGWGITNRARAKGVNTSLGADIVSNNSGDLFNQMRLSLQSRRAFADRKAMERGESISKVAVDVRDVLKDATIRGAKAAGLDSRIGSLVPGKEADIILINRDCLSMVPEGDPAYSTVMYASTGNVDTVIVGGEIKKRNGELVGFHKSELFTQLRESADFLLKESEKIDGTVISGLSNDMKKFAKLQNSSFSRNLMKILFSIQGCTDRISSNDGRRS